MTVEDVTRSTHATALTILVAALDWAALDDITTGHEPSFWMEWSFLALSAPLLFILWRTARR